MSLRSLITDLKEDTKKKFGGVDTAGSLSNKFWQSKAANNLASWQTLLSDPKSKIKFGQDYRYNPQDTRLQKANKWAGNVIKNAGESIVTMVPKVGYDIGQLGKGIVTGNTNNIEFSSAPARFGEDLSTYFVKDETGKPIRKPFDTVGYYGRGKWNVPFTQIKLPEMGFTESSAFSTGVKGVQAFEAPLAAKGLLNPLKLLTMAGFSSTIGGAANYVGSGAKEGSFEEGAWQTAYSMGPTLAKSSGLLSATDKFTTLGSVPMQSVTNVLQGIAYDKMSGTETTGGSIFIDALFPIASDVSGKAFKSFTEAAKTIQGKVLTGLGKHLRKSDGTYTTLAKWVKGTRPYRKGSAGALFGFEITQNEDGTWKVGFNDKKALAGIAIMTGGTKALKNLDSKSLGDNAGKNELEDILKAQEMKANKVGGGVKIPVDRARSLSPSSRNQYKENGILNTNKVQDITKIAQGTPEVLPKSPYSSLSSKQIITQNGAKIKEPTTIAEIEKTLYGSETVAPVSGTKTSVGFLGNKLRTIENLASDRVAKGLTSNNKYVRGIATVLQDLFGGAGKSQGQIVARAEYRGGIDYATKVANDSQKYVYDLLENDTKSLERVHAFLDPSISKIKVSEASLKPNEKEAVAYLRVVSDFINDTNYKNGFISKELWAKNKGGKYIARAYEPFDYPPEVADFIKDKSIRFDLNPFKQRGKVTDWKIENSIKDPAYLMSKRLQQTMFNSEVGKYTSWAKNSGLISDTAKPGFVQLSDSKAYGEVAGKWIRKDALEDVKGFFLTNDIAQKSYDILKWYDRNPARKLQKSLKTVFNPAVRLGNRTGNYVFAWLNGINPATFAKNKFWANAAIKNNDPMYRRAVQLGLTGTDVTKADIARISAELKRGINDKNVLSEIDGIIKESYGRVDDSSKLAAYKTWLDRGFTEKEAVNRARRGFQDYSMVGFLYDVGARLPVLGNPFVRFSAESIRIAKNAVIDHPIRAISTIAAWKIFTDVMSRISGETDEERTIREKRVGAAHVPFTNISMNVQTPWGEVNASRLIGFSTTFTPEDSMVPDVSKYAPIQNPLDVRSYGSDPLIGPLISIATDKDFRGKSIADPNQNKYQGSLLTDSERNKNRLGYLARSYAPPTITDIYNIGSAFQGQPNVYGQVKTPTQAILRTYPGVKVEQFGSEQVKSYKEREKKYNEYLLKSIDSKIRSIQKDIDSGTLDPIVGRKRIEALQKQKITEVSTSIRRFEESPEAPKTIPEKVKLAAQGIGADPLNTIKAIFTEERMRKISGNALILEREESLNKTPSEDDAVDHIIPLSLGGDNSKSNLRYISKEANREKAKLETKLARQLANKEITKSEARKQIKEWVDTYESGSTYTSADTSTDTEKSSTSESTPTYEGGYIEYTVGESKKKVKKTISMPKLTSNNELNKKIISDYKSDLTDYTNYIMYQFESGAISEEKAGAELERIAAIKKSLSKVTSSSSGSKKKKKSSNISQKILKTVKVQVKSPKFNTFEILNNYKKVKAPTIKAPNLKVIDFKTAKLKKGTK